MQLIQGDPHDLRQLRARDRAARGEHQAPAARRAGRDHRRDVCTIPQQGVLQAAAASAHGHRPPAKFLAGREKRRSPPSDSLARALGAIALAAVGLAPRVAHAEPLRLAGAARGTTRARRRGGAALVLGRRGPLGAVRVGGFTGLAAVARSGRPDARVLPVGPALAVVLDGGRVNASLRLRAGVWAGATDTGLAAGGLFGARRRTSATRSGAARASLRGRRVAHGPAKTRAWVVAPGVGLEWVARANDEPAARRSA